MGETIHQPGTVGQLIEECAGELARAGVFFGHGTANAIDEAASLVFHVAGLVHDAAAPAPYGLAVAPAVRDRVQELLAERITERVPMPYLLREAWFAGLSFYVDDRVLIPRSPFAELVGARFSPWLDLAAVTRILEIGTGSGCIAIACARAFPGARVDACDISADALDLACANVRAHQLERRIRVLQSDLFGALRGEQYDLIVSNPPYVPSRVVDRLPAELQAEPRLALDGGEQGLDVVARILHQAGQYLHKNGVLVVEVGDYKDELLQSFPDARFVWPQFANGGCGVFVTQASDLRLISPRHGR